jgi:SWIM zinc finger
MANWKFSENTPQSNWGGIMAKAQRLRLDGSVEVQQKEDGFVSGVVQGDHGTYNVQMAMANPESGIIDEWHCECPWFQYAFDRTEKYQKYEGRFCSHALALYWQSIAEPEKTPEEAAPDEERDKKPVEEQEMKWELEEPEEAQEKEIEKEIEEPQKAIEYPEVVQEPKVVSEVAPPPEPVEEPMRQEMTAEEPLMPEESNWQFEPQTEEQFLPETVTNSKTANTQNMKDIVTVKDLLLFIASLEKDIKQ